ncbi:MAG: hypothetical protein HQL75_02760 [Magnetococcales bacterium]|nr:hypothetical protein [Magnetococcales bacterium]
MYACCKGGFSDTDDALRAEVEYHFELSKLRKVSIGIPEYLWVTLIVHELDLMSGFVYFSAGFSKDQEGRIPVRDLSQSDKEILLNNIAFRTVKEVYHKHLHHVPEADGMIGCFEFHGDGHESSVKARDYVFGSTIAYYEEKSKKYLDQSFIDKEFSKEALLTVMDMLLQGKGEIVFAAACLSIMSKSIEDPGLIENHRVSIELYQKSMEVSHMRAFQNFLSQHCKGDSFLKNGFDVVTGMAGLSVG